MKGKVEKIWQNESTKGEAYWVFSIDGERYSVWKEELVKDIQEGDLVEFSWSPSGKFKKITAMIRAEQSGNPSSPEVQDKKGTQIARMSCLRSAAELISGTVLDPKEKVKLTLKIAKDFETYVSEEQR